LRILVYTNHTHMKSIRYSIAIAGFCLTVGFANAQVTGVQTVPGSFPSIAAAITALNTTGVGTGGATINVAAGYTEVLTAALSLNMATNPSSAANPLVFQKSGVGANPLVTAYAGLGTLDGIFVLNGSDYVTINGIDLQEAVANVTTTTQMEWGYALTKISGTNGCSFNTIKNCTVTLNRTNTAGIGIYSANHTSAVATAITVTSAAGTNSFNRYLSNTVSNAYTGYSLVGFLSAAPYDLYDQTNEIGRDVSNNRSRVLDFGGGALTANGVLTSNQNNIKVWGTNFNNTTAPLSTGIVNGINLGASLNANVDIYSDTLTMASGSTIGSTFFPIINAAGGTGAGNTVNIYNNVVTGCTYTTNTLGDFRGIATTTTASYTNMYGNKVTNNTIPGTGQFSAIYYGGSSATLCLAVNLYNNTISGNSKGAGTSGQFNMIFASASTNTTNCYGNQMFSNTATSSTGGFYGYYNFGFGLNENVYNNTIYSNTGGTGETSMLFVRSGSGPTNKQVYGNTIYTISGAGTAQSVGAIYTDYGTVTNIYQNNIYDISNTAASTAVPAVYGIQVGINVNTMSNVYNNLISDLRAPSATNTFSTIMGIWLNGSATSVMNAYYNTVYLNATTIPANNSTAALYCGPLGVSYDIRNNILANVSVSTGTGSARAIQRSAVALTNYNLNSGYNCLYAGVPSANNLLYFDGTNSIQNITALKALVVSREQSSFSSIPPFVNVATAPYNLHLQNTIATQCEGGAFTIAGFTTDYDGTTRNTTTPDVGADEILGITVDIAAPNIQYTLLGNSSVAPTRNCATFATITDPSGINTNIGTRPRIYYKKSTNTNAYNGNTNGTDGWKYVEASNTTSPFSFTIDYSLLFGGGGVLNGDIIQYFVVAQDLAGTPIVGINSGGFTSAPTSVNLSSANFPITNTINQYTIVAAALSGTINVGPTELITSLTNPLGIFNAINAGVLSGNLTINITGDLLFETGTFALNQWAEEGAGGYTVTIQSSAAVVRNIVGTNAAAALIRFDGADRVNVDGRVGGIGNFLMFRNTSNLAPTIGYINDAQNNTLQYCNIEGANPSTSTTLGGTIFIGSTTGPNGNDNITINNNDIRDRSDVAGTPNHAINIVGNNAGTLAQYNNNITISNNTIHDWFTLNGTLQYALIIGVGNSGFTITGNSFYQTATRTCTLNNTTNTRAIHISFTSTVASNGGHTITGNFIGGTAPGATGGDMTITATAGTNSQIFTGMSITTGLIPNNINGNIIRKIDFTSNTPAANTTMFSAITIANGIHNLGTTAGNIIGDSTTIGSIKLNMNAGGVGVCFFAGVLAATTNGSYDIRNNYIAGITIAGSATTQQIPQWIQIQGTPVTTTNVVNNKIGSTTVANSIQNNITAAASVAFCIRHLTTTAAPANITDNIIQNITDNSTNGGSGYYGVLAISTTGSSGTMNINNNTIRNISAAYGNASPVLLSLGIVMQNFAGTSHTISNNLISGMNCSNLGAFQGYSVGIYLTGGSMGGTIKQNRIADIRNQNTGVSPGILGIYIANGLDWTISNNMISLTNTGNTNSVDVEGIADFMPQNTSLKLYYNSVFLSGSVSAGALNSYCYGRFGNTSVTIKDNLFYNRRTGGTGAHIAIANAPALNPSLGWTGANVNYNAYITTDSSQIAYWNLGTNNMATWRTNSGGDLNSIYQSSTAVTFTALFVSANSANLHINTSTFPEALGTPIAGLTVDYDNNARSATFPTIGADELACSNIVYTATASTNVSCAGGTNGSATVGGTGGNGITYAWAPSGGTAATATGLAAGTYTCTITNICGNAGTVTVTITAPAPVVASISSSTNVDCNGNNNGSATVSATGGNSTYTYLWSSGGTLATESGLAPATYTVTVTDGNACTGTQTVTITEPAVLLADSLSQTNVLCNGDSSGTAAVTVSGGTTTYNYLWAPYGGTASSASNLASGVYTCTVTDANGCTDVQTFTVTTPNSMTVTPTQADVSCNADSSGTATVSVSGGAGSYTYAWSPIGGTAATATALPAGTYTCVITDANLCSTSQTFTITEPTVLAATAMQTNVACNADSTGDAMVMVTGGAGSYNYSWAPYGGTNANATGLIAGTYTCTITDANSCSMDQIFTITEPNALAVTTSLNNVLCFGGSNGNATVNVTGGSGSYTYNWTPIGGTNATATFLPIGSYTCSITDSLGCTVIDSVTITQPNQLTASIASSTNPTSCGGTDGTIDLLVVGGTPGFVYTWSNGDLTEDLNGVGAGNYNVTVVDTNGCNSAASITLSDPNPPAVTYNDPVSLVCVDDGSFTLTGGSPAGGTYSGPGVTGSTFSPTVAGAGTQIITYSYTDLNGCSATWQDSIMVDLCIGVNPVDGIGAFELYPNPNNGTFTLVLNTSTVADVLIYDALGQLVQAQKVQPGVQQNFFVETSGVYMVTVITADGKKTAQRVIVTQ
jgi:SprB repeat/Secretion system C-terminal sorting domain